MTSPKAITFMAFLFLGGLTLSFVLGGIWFDDAHRSILGSLTAIKIYNVMGLFKVPWVNVDFFTIGLKNLLTLNFAFFGGSYGALQYFLYIFSIGITWGIVALVIGVIYNFWSRR